MKRLIQLGLVRNRAILFPFGDQKEMDDLPKVIPKTPLQRKSGFIPESNSTLQWILDTTLV